MSSSAYHRILVCGNFSSRTMPQSRQCAEAFRHLGHEVSTVDSEDLRHKPLEMAKRWSKSVAKVIGCRQSLSDFYLRHERSARHERIRAAFREARPTFVLVTRGNDIEAELLEEMRADGAKVACWWIKDARRIQHMYEESGYYDLYYCIHENLCRDGIRYLPAWTVDSERYHPAANRTYARDLAFVGIWTPKRQQYLAALAGLDLAIVGPGWRSRPLLTNPALIKRVAARYVHGEALTRFYQESRIVININQWAASEASGTTLRVTDVPACGSFLLTEYSRGLEEVLTPGREVAVFNSPADLRDQVEHWLSHDAEREAIAVAGLARVRQLPTPLDRARRIISDLEALRP